MIAIPACTLVVAPASGRVAHTVADGTTVAAGDAVAEVDVGGRRERLIAPRRGVISGAIASSGQPVTIGDPVVWLVPA